MNSEKTTRVQRISYSSNQAAWLADIDVLRLRDEPTWRANVTRWQHLIFINGWPHRINCWCENSHEIPVTNKCQAFVMLLKPYYSLSNYFYTKTWLWKDVHYYDNQADFDVWLQINRWNVKTLNSVDPYRRLKDTYFRFVIGVSGKSYLSSVWS